MLPDLKYLFPRGSKEFHRLNPQISPSKSEPDKTKALGGSEKREIEGMGRVKVRYCGFFVRLQDPENFSASTKDCTDGLRRCGLIYDDDPENIELITTQKRVSTFDKERLEITITYPGV